MTGKQLKIGIVGENGAGKDTVEKILTELLREKGETVGRTSSGGVLRDTLVLWGIEVTRANLQDLAIIMDRQYGTGSLSGAVGKRMSEKPHGVVIFNGVRWQTDADIVDILLYVTAPPEVRFERMKKRGEKALESEMTWEQFLEEDGKETETRIPVIGATAGWTIRNDKDTSLKDLEFEIAAFLMTLPNKEA